MYIVKKSIRKNIREHGFRCSRDFMPSMDLAVDFLLGGLYEWTKPKKTITRFTLISYLAHHKIGRTIHATVNKRNNK